MWGDNTITFKNKLKKFVRIITHGVCAYPSACNLDHTALRYWRGVCA